VKLATSDARQLAGVEQVFLTGVAEDYCVKYTALQAAWWLG